MIRLLILLVFALCFAYPASAQTVVYSQEFSADNGSWRSYDYAGDLCIEGVPSTCKQNFWYPAMWSPEGFAWTDNKNWRIDLPETPDSVLALAVYPQWYNPRPLGQGNQPIDFRNATFSFDIRGKDLDLKGGAAHIFVTGPGGRWTTTPAMPVVNGEWTHYAVDLGAVAWHRSWGTSDGSDEPMRLQYTTSFGIKFEGFADGQEPTGVLELDNVLITRP